MLTKINIRTISRWDKKLPTKLASRRQREGEQPLTKLPPQYQPHGNRYVGHPRRRWREQDHLKVNGAPQDRICSPKPTMFMMMMMMMIKM